MQYQIPKPRKFMPWVLLPYLQSWIANFEVLIYLYVFRRNTPLWNPEPELRIFLGKSPMKITSLILDFGIQSFPKVLTKNYKHKTMISSSMFSDLRVWKHLSPCTTLPSWYWKWIYIVTTCHCHVVFDHFNSALPLLLCIWSTSLL